MFTRRGERCGNSRFSASDSQNWPTSCTVLAPDNTSTTSTFTYGSDGMRRRGVVATYATGGGVIGGRPTGIGPPSLIHNSHPNLSPTPVFGSPSQGAATGSTRTDYIYDGTMLVEQIIQHFSSSGTALDTPTTITYLQGPQGPLYRKSSAVADPSWYVYDGLGSVVGEVDVNGNLTASKLFDVYGLTRSVSGSPTTRQGFVGGLGHESDDETGLIYMRHRYYDAATGRFISEDPQGSGGNWYIYCNDDPVNIKDPHGLFGIVDIALSSQFGMTEDAEAGGQALGILARTNQMCQELETMTDAVDSLEILCDPIKDQGILDEIEDLGYNSKNWYKAYANFDFVGGDSGVKVHAFFQIVNGVVQSMAVGGSTPWYEEYYYND